MRSWHLLLTSALLLSGAAVPLAAVAEEQACTLRMSAETDFPPHLIKQNDNWTGLSVELMQRLADEVHCKLEFINSPWLRALQQSEQGQLDVLSHLSFSEQRKGQFAFIGPHHIEAIYLVGDPATLPASSQLSDLIDKVDYGRIAVLHGAYYGEDFARLSRQPAVQRQLVEISSIQDKLALLRAGRVNAILEDISVLHYWQQHHYPDADTYQPLLKVYQSPVYFGFSKTSLPASTLTTLAEAWQKLYRQGDLAAIYQKYQISNYAELIPAPIL